MLYVWCYIGPIYQLNLRDQNQTRMDGFYNGQNYLVYHNQSLNVILTKQMQIPKKT